MGKHACPANKVRALVRRIQPYRLYPVEELLGAAGDIFLVLVVFGIVCRLCGFVIRVIVVLVFVVVLVGEVDVRLMKQPVKRLYVPAVQRKDAAVY